MKNRWKNIFSGLWVLLEKQPQTKTSLVRVKTLKFSSLSQAALGFKLTIPNIFGLQMSNLISGCFTKAAWLRND